ncbi:zf-HC2 domain-containing protein [Hydrogenophaga sp.]|jgi:Putative zinc-finger|uniref:zf-HC2 domain-containing protein n=1 Tax=Hydrogenophaga sp. TaxID=1904254 RepID=UPI003F729517
MKPVYPFRRTCKEVSALLIAREDRALPLAERLALRLHLAMCEACPRFERQLLTMRNAMGQWRNYTEE